MTIVVIIMVTVMIIVIVIEIIVMIIIVKVLLPVNLCCDRIIITSTYMYIVAIDTIFITSRNI